MLRANCSITPAKPSRVRAVPEVSESSEDADGIGTDEGTTVVDTADGVTVVADM